MINKANLIITHKCNLFCKHCYMNANNNHYESEEEILNRFNKLIPKLKENNIKEIMITGGECSISPLLEQIINSCKKENIKTSIFTNGIIIRQIELDNIDEFHISLDGKKEHHNYIRGTEFAYEMLMKNIKTLKEHNKDIHIHMTVTEQNIEDIKDIINILETFNITNLNISALLDEGRCIENNINTKINIDVLINNIYKLTEENGYKIKIHTNIFNNSSINNYLLQNAITFPLWIDLINDNFYIIKEDKRTSKKLNYFTEKNIKIIYNNLHKLIQKKKDYLLSKQQIVLENELIYLLSESSDESEK